MSGFIAVFYLLAFSIGGVIGASEIVSRYRDEPFLALCTKPALLYVALNGLASLGAFWIIREFGLLHDIGVGPGTDVEFKREFLQAAIAGMGAMALFRTAFLNVRIGNKDVGIGTSAFLQIFMDAADRACDRARAESRARVIKDIMKGISFEKAQVALQMLCAQLMQNLGAEEQKDIADAISGIQKAKMDDIFKVNNLGLKLMNVMGERALRRAVETFSSEFRPDAQTRSAALEPQPVVSSTRMIELLHSARFEDAHKIFDACLIAANRGNDPALRLRLDVELAKIAAMPGDDGFKSLLLCAELVNTFGEDVLAAVLEGFRESPASNVVSLSRRPPPPDDSPP